MNLGEKWYELRARVVTNRDRTGQKVLLDLVMEGCHTRRFKILELLS